MKYIILLITALSLTACKDPLVKDKQDIIAAKNTLQQEDKTLRKDDRKPMVESDKDAIKPMDDTINTDKTDDIDMKNTIESDTKATTSTILEGPLWYPTNTKTAYNIARTKDKHPFTSDTMYSHRCNESTTKEQFDTVLKPFQGAYIERYSFTATNEHAHFDPSFYVSVMENKAHYTSLDAFKKDFDVCTAGSSYYPTLLNNDYLVFISSCGTGAGNMDDTDKNTDYCSLIKEQILPHITLQKDTRIKE